jgi:hypothetical protein
VRELASASFTIAAVAAFVSRLFAFAAVSLSAAPLALTIIVAAS